MELDECGTVGGDVPAGDVYLECESDAAEHLWILPDAGGRIAVWIGAVFVAAGAVCDIGNGADDTGDADGIDDLSYEAFFTAL